MSEWISVEDELPPEEVKMNTLYFDVWRDGFREVGVKFKGGEFYRQCVDYQGDYSHDELIENVTHWLEPEPPTNNQIGE